MKIIYNNTSLEIQVADNSYRYRAIKGEHNLTLYFSLPEYVELPIGAYCEFEAETYTLESPENFTMHSSRNFEYTVIFESSQAKLRKYKFRNLVDNRLKFDNHEKPHKHLEMLIDNLNKRDSGWSAGECVDAVAKNIAFNHTYCMDALAQMADAFETEWEIVGKTIHLRKVEYNKDNPLPLSYGRGNGFKPGVGRTNFNNSKPIEVLFVQGGERNIDASKYKNKELLLPKGRQTLSYDGKFFEGQTGFNAAIARRYITAEDRLSIQRADKELRSKVEDSLDLSHIHPSRVGEVTRVEVTKVGFCDFFDTTIPENLNYSLPESRYQGETMTVIFQSGELAGKEFEIKQTENRVTGYIHSERRFKVLEQMIDGVAMPKGSYMPKVGDKYAVFGIALPDVYVCDNDTKSGASWDMFREAVKYLDENQGPKFSFTGELDGIWAKKDWLNIGGRIRLGGYILFSDAQFQIEGVGIRIVGIKDYINNPYSPEIELSNAVVGSSIMSDIRKIESNEVVAESQHKESLQFTKRRFRDSQQTITALEEAMDANFSNFSTSISPIAVQTMSMLVGDENLQFAFVQNPSSTVEVAHNVTYDTTKKQLSVPGGFLQHKTLDVNSISAAHTASEYKTWSMPSFLSAVLTDAEQKYYVYAKVSKTAQTGQFIISPTPVAIETEQDYYHLLLGLLNSDQGGARSYVSLYGFTEILPGRITTDRIVSTDGESFLDLQNNAFRIGDTNSSLDWNNIVENALSISNATIKMGDKAGKTMIYFSGIDGSGHLAGGNFTFDKEGNVKLNGEISTQGGRIGQFDISNLGSLRSSGQSCYNQASCWLSYERLSLESNASTSTNRGVMFMVTGGASGTGNGYCGGTPVNARIDIHQTFSEMSGYMLKQKIGLGISVDGGFSKNAIGDDPAGNHAIFIEKGGFVGFRPFSRVISSSEVLLETDSVVVADTSSANITLTLPLNPQPDQKYIIRKLKSKNTLYIKTPGGTNIMYWQNSDTPSSSSGSLVARRTLELQYISELGAWIEWESHTT